MRFVRYQLGSADASYGWIYEDQVGPVEGDIFHDYRRKEANIPLSMVRLAAPVIPGKVIGIINNYVIYSGSDKPQIPDIPLLHFKPHTTIIGPNEPIYLPPQSKNVVHEAELALVIGKVGRWIGVDNARDYIFGYTIANDITAQDLLEQDGVLDRAKGFDTFCPIGPWIETELDPVDLLITCRVDAEMRQMASTHEMVFTIPQLVAFISSVMTLQPGDVILTGSPAGSGPIEHGNHVEVSIEGIGTLTNPVEFERDKLISRVR